MLRIVAIAVLAGHTVRLVLTDGSTREVDLAPLLTSAGHVELLDDRARFAAVGVEHGTLAWPTGEDLDPDVLLDNEVARRGPARRHIQH